MTRLAHDPACALHTHPERGECDCFVLHPPATSRTAVGIPFGTDNPPPHITVGDPFGADFRIAVPLTRAEVQALLPLVPAGRCAGLLETARAKLQAADDEFAWRAGK